MTGKTHRVGGMLCVLGGFTFLEARGMLIGNVNPLVQLAVMYPFGIFGSILSDFDHNWHSCPSKDIVGLGIHRVLHLSSGVMDRVDRKSFAGRFLSVFDARHRSWQTHSDLFLFILLGIYAGLFSGGSSVSASLVILRLMCLGLLLGVISHLVLDMLTPEGIWSFVAIWIRKVFRIWGIRKKISLVPNIEFFRTGGTWESIIRFVMWGICILLFINLLISISPFSISFLGS